MVSKDPYIRLSPDGDVVISIKQVDQSRHINALSDSGMATLYICCGDMDSADSSENIWIVDVDIRYNSFGW